jgi:polysaccharide deacetylase 2 family uncharacterized protein YibQ
MSINKNKSTSILSTVISIIMVVLLVASLFYYISIELYDNSERVNVENESKAENVNLSIEKHFSDEKIKAQKVSPIVVEKIDDIVVVDKKIDDLKVKKQISNNSDIVNDNDIKLLNETKFVEKEIHKLYEEPVESDMIIVDHKSQEINEDMIEKVAIKKDSKKYKIAIVIDDMGINRKKTKDIANIKSQITSSYLSYARNIPNQVKTAQKSGHQIIIHVPMQPKGNNVNAGPNVIKEGMKREEISNILNKSIDKFPMAHGINNHMGSRLTEVDYAIDEIMSVLSKKGLFFLDSKTTSKSVCKELAEKYDVKYLYRNVFIDNVNEKKYILNQLEKAESIAIKNGYAIAIGHPKQGTIDALKEWLPSLKEKNIKIVHLSDLLPE